MQNTFNCITLIILYHVLACAVKFLFVFTLMQVAFKSLSYLIIQLRFSLIFQCFSVIFSVFSSRYFLEFNLGLLIFIDVTFLLYCTCSFLYRTIMLYTTISLIKYVCMCGGHHDRHRVAVSVMVSQAVYLPKLRFPSFLPSLIRGWMDTLVTLITRCRCSAYSLEVIFNTTV